MPPLKLSILSDDVVSQFLDEAIQLLSNPGIRVHNPEGLRLLAEASADVDASSQIARIPESLVRQSVGSAPKEFYLYNLSGQPTVRYGRDTVVLCIDPSMWAVRYLRAPFKRELARSGDAKKYQILTESSCSR